VQLITAWGPSQSGRTVSRLWLPTRGDIVHCEISPPAEAKRGRQPNATSAARKNVWYMCKRGHWWRLGTCCILAFCH
jgi:hypothetical protein